MSKSLRNRKEQYGVFISPVCYFSNKKDKRIANRRFRRLSKQDAHISTIKIEDCFKRHSMREVSDPWSFDSDGLRYYKSFSERSLYDNEPYSKEDIRKMRMK